MSTLKRAEEIARACHAGQVDKAGVDYIEHPLRLCRQLREEGYPTTYQIVALLHDVIEDGDVSPDDLLADGFAEDIVAAVVSLTKHEGEHGENGYDRFIQRIVTDGPDIALVVKLADLRDNLNLSRMRDELSDEDRRRAERYRKAQMILSKELTGRREENGESER